METGDKAAAIGAEMEEEREEMAAISRELEAIHARLMARAKTFGETDDTRARQSAASFAAEICAGFGGDTLADVLQVYGNSVGSVLEDHFCCVAHALAEVAKVAQVALNRMQVGIETGGAPEAGNCSGTKH